MVLLFNIFNGLPGSITSVGHGIKFRTGRRRAPRDEIVPRRSRKLLPKSQQGVEPEKIKAAQVVCECEGLSVEMLAKGLVINDETTIDCRGLRRGVEVWIHGNPILHRHDRSPS